MKPLTIITAVAVGLAATSLFGYSNSTVSELRTESNGRYKVEGLLRDQPNGHSLSNEGSTVSLNGNCDCSGYGEALVRKEGNNYNLVSFSQQERYLKVVEFKDSGGSTIAVLENGRSINFDSLDSEQIHRSFFATYVIY